MAGRLCVVRRRVVAACGTAFWPAACVAQSAAWNQSRDLLAQLTESGRRDSDRLGDALARCRC